jgi:hypothetical protein
MDITPLMQVLAPTLPWLLKLGDKAAEKAAEKIGEDTWGKAKAIWDKLNPKVQAKPSAKEALDDFIANPEDPDLQAVLRVQLKKLLENDRELAAAIDKILNAPSPLTNSTQIQQSVTGNQNQIIGQVSGSQIFGNITGTVILGGSTNQEHSDALPCKTILVLAANPKDTTNLRLSEEVRELQVSLQRSQYRDRFKLEQRWAVTPRDVWQALLDCKPQIVHFSGHGIGSGSGVEGLVFENQDGQSQIVSGDALTELFSRFADRIECLILNACYSEVQAQLIVQHIPYVIGMKRAIGDQAAIAFTTGFYDALLAGRSVDSAYEIGCVAVQVQGIPEHLTPTLKKKFC